MEPYKKPTLSVDDYLLVTDRHNKARRYMYRVTGVYHGADRAHSYVTVKSVTHVGEFHDLAFDYSVPLSFVEQDDVTCLRTF